MYSLNAITITEEIITVLVGQSVQWRCRLVILLKTELKRRKDICRKHKICYLYRFMFARFESHSNHSRI